MTCLDNIVQLLFFSDNKRKLLFALNFKVGASTLIRAIANSSGRVPPAEVADLVNVDLRTMGKLKHYGLFPTNIKTRSGLRERFKSYFRFMFVRNPYHRLLSAFRDKFRIHEENEQEDVWFEKTVKIIKDRYRKSGSTAALARLADNLKETAVSFEEFLKFVLDDIKDVKHTNPHWKPLSLLSMPCYVNYDFIGKLETFAADFQLLMSKIAVKDVPETKFHSSPGLSTAKVFQKYWSQIPKTLVQQIEKAFEKDFEMFQYDKDLSSYMGLQLFGFPINLI